MTRNTSEERVAASAEAMYVVTLKLGTDLVFSIIA
jgi:hypothetical protein